MVLRPDPATFAILPWTRRDERARGADAVRHRDARRHAVRRLSAHARSSACSTTPHDVLRGVKTALEVEFYLFAARRGRHADDAHRRLRLVLRLLALRSRRRSAHRDGGRARSDGDRRLERPPRTRRRPARARLGRGLGARHRRPAHHRARRGEADRDPARHPRDVHAEADRDRRPATGCTSTSRWATSTKSIRLHAIAGLLEHAPGFTAVCNPTVNSYKRLVAAWDAPVLHRVVAAQRERAGARPAAARRTSR